MLLVQHVRQALQQAAAIGACSLALFTIGSIRVWARSNTS